MDVWSAYLLAIWSKYNTVPYRLLCKQRHPKKKCIFSEFLGITISSDRCPIIVELHTTVQECVKKYVLHNKKPDWLLFRELKDKAFEKPVSLKPNDEIAKAVVYFTISVQDAAWFSIPQLTHRSIDNYKAKHILNNVTQKRGI